MIRHATSARPGHRVWLGLRCLYHVRPDVPLASGRDTSAQEEPAPYQTPLSNTRPLRCQNSVGTCCLFHLIMSELADASGKPVCDSATSAPLHPALSRNELRPVSDSVGPQPLVIARDLADASGQSDEVPIAGGEMYVSENFIVAASWARVDARRSPRHCALI